MFDNFMTSPRTILRASARASLLATLLLLSLPTAHAEQERVVRANYKQASQYSAEYLRQFVYDTNLFPNWIGKTDSFWYGYRTSQGTHYYRVNPSQGTKAPLFDCVKLGTLLSEMTQKPWDACQLPLGRMSINDEGTKIKFVVDDFQYEYDLQAEKLVKVGKAPPAPIFPAGRGRFGRGMQQNGQQLGRGRGNNQQLLQQQDEQQRVNQQQDGQTTGRGGRRGGGRGGDYRAFAPDRKAYVFARQHNLYVVEGDKESDAVQITKDGVENYSYGGSSSDAKARPAVTWSRDSKMFYVLRSDVRGEKELYLVDSLALPRPTLEKYRYPMPGEEGVRKVELHVYDRGTKKIHAVKPKWKDESFTDVHWGKAAEELRFLRHDRLLRHVEFCALNVKSDECKCLIVDGFDNTNVASLPMRYLEESDEMIWWSERSGWGHFYLYDRNGKFKNAITSGAFRAGQIVDVDAKNRLVYFRGNAREVGENVYYQHLYSVHLDGTGLVLMDPGDGTHQSLLSPSHQYLVDNCSRVDLAPVATLRDATGRTIMKLEEADLSRLKATGWRMPERFVVKAADGVTDLYGNLWRPFDFNPAKKYSIIAHVYPGPQQEGVTHTFSAINGDQQLAQLGFIVIQVGHRGGTPQRSKAYHSYGYYNLRDYGLADKKAAIEQLAERFGYIDIDRVGIYGHSGGGFMSAAAVLQKPYNEFFKAAVASSGNHDNNIYNSSWAERYHGLKEVVIKKDDTKKDTKTGTAAAVTGGVTETSQDGSNDEPDDLGKKLAESKQVQQKETKAQEKKSAQATSNQQKDVTTLEKKGVDIKDDKKSKEQTKKVESKVGEQTKKVDAKAQEETRFEIKVPTNAELAANLKGALMLVHGEIDNNVHPANTMRLVDALIKANKRFDMLIIPGKRHGYGDYQPYFTQRMWDFFADHLIGDRPAGADILEKGK